MSIWLSSALIAWLGAWICFAARPGVNWGIWTTAAAVGLAWHARRATGRVPRVVALLLVLACVLAFGAAFTATGFLDLLIVGSTATVLANAMVLAAQQEPDAAVVGGRAILLAPLRGGAGAGVETITRSTEALAASRAGRALPAVRGTAMAVPVAATLALLLSAADPTLASWRDAVGRFLTDFTELPRVVFFFALGALVLGANGLALRRESAVLGNPGAAPRLPRVRVGDTERVIVLGAACGVLALYFALQLGYLFGGVAGQPGSGVTYAEWARRGFGELTVAATLAGGLIVWLGRRAEPGPRDAVARTLSLALLALVQVLLISAFRRVLLYEQAYGYTEARLYAQAYMVVVSLVLIQLVWEVWGDMDVRRIARHAAVYASLAIASLSYWNHDAWIARRNIARFASTQQLDINYLITALSPGAIPALVSDAATLPPTQARALRDAVAKQLATERDLRPGHWYEWNRARERAQGSGARIQDSGVVGPSASH